MCGVFGNVGAPLEMGTIDNVLAVLRHRGPDASGSEQMQGATLAHTRLSVIDLSVAAAQPMSDQTARVWVTFNGEIYNFLELRRELEGLGHSFASRSDTEVIIQGYLRWGDAVVDRLDGMFAFGLWDVGAQRLLLARDRAGKKPLFYAQHQNRFLFSSEIKGLFAAGVPADISPQGVLGYLAYGYSPPPGTNYHKVFQLPPAHRLVLERNQAPVVARYWSLSFQERGRLPSEAEACERIRHLLGAAVQRRLVSDVPLGAFLSGGLDSTIIVALMAKQGPRVRTFAIGSPEPRYDETQFARLAASRYGTDHTELQVTPADFHLVEKLVWHHDGPFGDSSAMPSFVVSELTRKHVTVALTGDGGDELFAGYLRFAGATATEHIPRSLRPILSRLSQLLPGGLPSRSHIARAKRFFCAAAMPFGDRLAKWTSYFAFGYEGLLRPQLQNQASEVLRFHRDIFDRLQAQSPLAQALGHNFDTYLPQDLLVKTDRTSMANALETRSPFLDTALMEYVASLPDNFKLKGRTTKYILRQAFGRDVPVEILARKKMGFGIPLATWFRASLKSYLGDHLAAPTARIGVYVNLDFVQRLLAEHWSGQADHEQQLWALLTMEIWLRNVGGLARPWPST